MFPLLCGYTFRLFFGCIESIGVILARIVEGDGLRGRFVALIRHINRDKLFSVWHDSSSRDVYQTIATGNANDAPF